MQTVMRIEKLTRVLAAVGGILAAGACSQQSDGAPPIGASGDSGIAGRVVAWPVCPVETGEPQCAGRPIAARIAVSGAADQTVEVGEDGLFQVTVPPGNYVLEATAEGMPCKPVDIAVPSGEIVQAEIRCDTGIR
jgi:hypothetical protein